MPPPEVSFDFFFNFPANIFPVLINILLRTEFKLQKEAELIQSHWLPNFQQKLF